MTRNDPKDTTMPLTLIAAAIAAALAAPLPAVAQESTFIFEHRHIAANEAAADAGRAARDAAREAREQARLARDQADVWKRWAEDFSRDMRSSMGTMFAGHLGGGPLVKGAPYSADVLTEVTQTLADGNVISRRNSGAAYRDSEGRTRQESGGDGKDRSIFINDPVGGKHYVLTPGRNRATATSLPKVTSTPAVTTRNRQVVRVDDTEVRVEDGRVFLNGVETPESSVRMNSKRGNDVRVENGRILVNGKELQAHPPKDGEDGQRREEVRIVVRSSDFPPLPPMPPMPPMPPLPPVPGVAPIPPMPPMPGIQTMRFESTAKLGKGTTTSLGMKDFDGVKADGKMTVWTIPAGEIGNRNPIVVKSESWYSPELQLTVYSRYDDPRTGETVYRLANLKRGEPAPDLFKAPEETGAKEKPGR